MVRPHFHTHVPWISDPAGKPLSYAHGSSWFPSVNGSKPPHSPPSAGSAPSSQSSHSSLHPFPFPPTPPKDATPDPSATTLPGEYASSSSSLVDDVKTSSFKQRNEGSFYAHSFYQNASPYPTSGELSSYHSGYHQTLLNSVKSMHQYTSGYGSPTAKPKNKTRSSAGKPSSSTS